MAHRVTLIRGDGIGPELSEATRRVLEATGVEFDWVMQDAGEGVMDEHGTPLPEHVLASIRDTGTALKGPITTPVGSGFRSVNVALRKEFDLYAQVRPAKSYEGVRSRYEDIDLVIVRENTEDLYAGVEFEKGSQHAEELTKLFADWGNPIPQGSGISIKPISEKGVERVVTFAFEYARANGRRKVTSVHKANIMKHTDGLWLDVSRQVAERYTDIEFEDRIVDNMCMQLVQNPDLYDVMVLPNLYGDIVSDVCAGLVGGLGVAPGANFGAGGISIFEPVHGSAPKYAGQNKANPMAMMLSAVMMLRHLGETEAAERMEGAIARVVAEGKDVTYDLKPDRNDPSAVGTSEFGDAIIDAMQVATV